MATPAAAAGKKPFRAVIVGGGPVGLTLAHTLAQANIDFVVLEARDTVFADEGASIILYPGALRIYAQLGILDAALKLSFPITLLRIVNWDGTLARETENLSLVKQLHGAAPQAFHRQTLVKMLYDTLDSGSQKKIHTGKKVTDVQSTSEGVTVTCADGTSFDGSIVIGADGVHSKTRGFMRNLALKAAESDPSVKVNPEKPYKASYRCMWGNYAADPNEPSAGENHDCHGPKLSSMTIYGPERSWFFMYEQLDAPTQTRQDYSAADMEQYAQKFADMHLTDKVRFKEVWPKRNNAGMSDLYEGTLDHWHHGRVVLVGDAAFKVTPNIGWGYNSGSHSVVTLTNALHDLIYTRDNPAPTTEQLSEVFAKYGEERRADLGMVQTLSAFATRQHAWPVTSGGWLYRWVEKLMNLLPSIETFLVTKIATKVQRAGRVLDFVRFGEDPCKSATVPWTYPYPTKG